jgi:hypothetical protein
MYALPRMLFLLAGLLILTSCSGDAPTDPVDRYPAPADALDPIKSASQTLINNYIIQYDGRTYDGNETTFAYTVFGTGVDPALSHFTLELPDCAPELSGFSPTNSVSINTNPQTGIYGIEWHLSVEADDLVGRQYSITFPGDVPEGVVRSAVKSGNTDGVGQVPGPCAGFRISGAVYVDADADGARDFDESGIADVAVELVYPDGSTTALVTDALGDFTSMPLAAGIYTLRIDYAGYPGSFNAELGDSFDATTPLEIQVTVGPDSAGNEFGFSPQTDEIVQELETGVLVSNGEDVRFWTAQVRAALRNGGGNNVVHTREQVLGFLEAINDLYLPEIFQFTIDDLGLQAAYDILKTRPRTPLEELRQQLLATEFNEVSGRGIVADPELQDVLIAWGEAVWVENQENARSGAPGNLRPFDVQDVATAAEDFIPPAIDVFTLINTGGGGSVDE